MKVVALTGALIAVLVAGCGGGSKAAESAPLPTLPASALPELNAAARVLGTAALAADSFDPKGVAKLLEDEGYLAGSEREFAGRGQTFDHVVARTLRFAGEQGAQGYATWVAGHAADFLGKAKREQPLGLGESDALFSLVRCAVCKKQQPAFVSAWRHGNTVAFLLGAGPGVTRETFAALARQLDERISP